MSVVSQSQDDLLLLLWASAWLNSAMFDDRWEFERGIIVPAVDRVPDLSNPEWPKVRDQLLAVREEIHTGWRRAA